jgi:YesN/AraC family two-component response regulator
MDILSDVLRIVRLSGAVFFTAEFSSPWALDSPNSDLLATISRSALAERFTQLIGESPMRYLAGWRVQLAKQMLRDGDSSVAEIAARVGYESEAAFNRAFKRTAGSPPAAWRKCVTSALVSAAALLLTTGPWSLLGLAGLST